MTKPTISIIGLGYIGLPTAAVLAHSGATVIGVDINATAVATINQGRVHIVEPGLERLVADMTRVGRLSATTTPVVSDAFLIAVPTPFAGDHAPDLSYVEAAARSIAPVLVPGNVVILESTSPVGATEQMAKWMAAERPDLVFPLDPDGREPDIHVAYCPERVLPGNVLEELVSNDRVIGGLTPACSTEAAAIYRLFVKGQTIATTARTAEMCKLTENSFRDVNIAFANELSTICDRLGINVWELIELANRHPRVNILQPGPGVGGHCIAVDPWFIVHSAPDQARLIRQARIVNDDKPAWVIDRVRGALAEIRTTGKRPVLACLGLAFKANIDDLRESPALAICETLANEDCALLIAEPFVESLPPKLQQTAELMDACAAVAKADVVALLVDHAVFRAIPDDAVAGKILVDTRGLWRSAK